MKYVSGRVKELRVGISSHTEDKTPFSVIGSVNITGDIISTGIGITNLNVSGVSTFTGAIDANGDLDVDGHTELDNVNVSGIATFTDVIDSNGQIVGAATSNIVPFLYSNYSLFPSATTYHGAVAHAHNTGKLYYAHGGNWIELVNKETNGTVGTGTEKYDIGITSVTNLYVSGISTYNGNLDVQSSVLITGITTIGGLVDINAGGQANTFKVEDLTDNRVVIAGTGGELEDDANLTFNGSTFNVGSGITMYQATGIISATAFYGDGSGLDNTGATLSASSGIQRLVLTSLTSGTMTSAATDADLSFDATTNLLSAGKLLVSGISTFNDNIDANGDVDITGHAGIGSLSVTGVSTFTGVVNATLFTPAQPNITSLGALSSLTVSGNIDANGDLDVDGHTELDNLNVSGVSTFSGLLNANGNVDLGGDSADTISVNGRFDTNLVPSADVTQDLGQATGPTRRWGTLHVKNILQAGGGISTIQQLNVAGVTTFSDDVTFVGAAGTDATWIKNRNVLSLEKYAKIEFGDFLGNDRKFRIFDDDTSKILSSNDLTIQSTIADIRLTASLGNMTLSSDNVVLKPLVGGNVLKTSDTTAFLYYSGSEKLKTTSTGVVVTGIATATSAVLGSAKVSDLTDNRLVIAGTAGELEDTSKLTFNGSTLAVVGDANFTGNVTVQGTLTSEDKTNIDSIGIVTARTGVRISSGGLVVASGVSTFTDAIDSNGGANISGGSGLVASTAKISDLTNTRVVFVGTAGELQDNSGFTFNGSTVTAPAFSGDGSALTGITAGGVGAIGGLTVKDEGVVVGTAGSVSTLDFKGSTLSVIATAGAAGVATVTAITEQNQNIQTLNVSGISTFNGNINLISTDAGSAAGPELKLHRNSSSPADADYLGQIKFAGESDTGVERNYAKITGKILDASNTTEDGIIEFAHIKNGSQTITGRWRSDSLQLLNGTSLTVAGDVSATNFNSTSDARLKTNVQTITSPLEKLNQIDGVSFDWTDNNESSMGVIADTVEKVFPELISQTGDEYKTVNYNGLIGLLIEAVKEQQVQITELKTKLDSLS